MNSRRVLVGVAAVVVLAGTAFALMGGRARTSALRLASMLPDVSSPRSIAWPDERVSLTAVSVQFPPDFGRRRIFLDAGHGAEGNTGNSSATCQDEQDFTLHVATFLGQALKNSGHFDVRLSRKPDELTAYPDRVKAAKAWKADAFVSIHSDVRGKGEVWSPAPGKSCRRNNEAPGFSVLWSDEGDAKLTARRRSLAGALARELHHTGFLPYGGQEYLDLYEGDPKAPGVFVDRHAIKKRIFVLRRPVMPSVIIETHNAWDTREVERWTRDETLAAFSTAVMSALVEQLK